MIEEKEPERIIISRRHCVIVGLGYIRRGSSVVVDTAMPAVIPSKWNIRYADSPNLGWVHRLNKELDHLVRVAGGAAEDDGASIHYHAIGPKSRECARRIIFRHAYSNGMYAEASRVCETGDKDRASVIAGRASYDQDIAQATIEKLLKDAAEEKTRIMVESVERRILGSNKVAIDIEAGWDEALDMKPY